VGPGQAEPVNISSLEMEPPAYPRAGVEDRDKKQIAVSGIAPYKRYNK